LIKDYRNIDEYLWKAQLGVEKKLDDFVVYSYEDVSQDAIITQSAYRHHYFELSLDINEGCSFQIDDFNYPVEGNRLTVIAPNRLQTNIAHQDLIEESKGFTMFFNQDFLGADFHHKRFWMDFPFLYPKSAPAFYLSDKQVNEIVTIFNLLKYEQKEYGASSVEVIRHLTKVIFEKVRSYQTSQIDQQNYSPLVSEFILLCNRSFLYLHSVKEYAQKLAVTPKHLTEIVKQQTGLSALEMIHRAKVTYAKGLLAQTSLSVKQVAYELGFENPEYFCVFFKKKVGKTPSQYRQF